MPSHHASFWRQGHVREDGVAGDGRHGVGIRRSRRPGRDTTAGLGIDARKRPSASGLIQAMSSPTIDTFQPFIASGG